MTGTPVQAVWVWRFTKAPYKATYGRLDGTTYTKDYLQASGSCAKALEVAFGGRPGDLVAFAFKWPGGQRLGTLFAAADYELSPRFDVRWETDNAPEPWKLFPSNSRSPLKTILGNPDHSTAAAADREFQHLLASNLDPWVLAVRLFGDEPVLHVRAYLGSPPPSLSHASTRWLPDRVRTLLTAVPARGGCSSLLEDQRLLLECGGEILLFDPSKVHDAWSVVRVDGAGFEALLGRTPITSIAPPQGRSAFGAPYRKANVGVRTRTKVFTSDPDKVDRGLRAHAKTQNALAERVESSGLTPMRSRAGSCDFDIAWDRAGTIFVAEVKSLTGQNERLQLRLGLGQVLHYAFQLRSKGWMVQPVLAIERAPTDPIWSELCKANAVELVWPGTMDRLF